MNNTNATNELPNHLLPFIWNFLKKYPYTLVAYLIIIFIASLEISLSPYILKLMIDTTTQYFNNTRGFLIAISFPAILYVLLTFIHNGAMRGYHYICFKLFPKLRSEISVSIFSYLSSHSVSFFQRNFSGDLANKILNITEGVESIIKIFNQHVLGNLFTLIIGFILIMTVHFFFAIVLLLMIILYIINGYFYSRKTAIVAHEFSKASSHLSGQLVDSITNIVSAKVFSNVSFETTRVEEAVNTVGEQDKSLQKQIMRTDFVQNLIFSLLITLLLSGLIYGRVHDWITVGDFAFILGLSITIYSMVNGLTRSMPELSKEIGKCRQALDVIIVQHEIKDVENARPLTIKQGRNLFQKYNVSS